MCQQHRAFALKRFKPSSDAKITFFHERSILEALSKQPYDHIVTHLASFKDQDTCYILFPLARCNLRVFFNTTPVPLLRSDFVRWFFSQVKGLADAVLHIHDLKSSLLKHQSTSHQSLPLFRSAIHGDIKPENILVFEPDSHTSLGVFKISDFGSSMTMDDNQPPASSQTMKRRGTQAYEAPDISVAQDLSCAVDMWSLGCVLLEMLDWAFTPQGSEEIGFMTQRWTETHSGSASFWQTYENGKVGIKHSVGCRLVALEKSHILGKLPFERLLHGVWFLLICARDTRSSALHLVRELESIVSKLEADLAEDPDCYLHHTVIPTHVAPSPKPLHPIYAKLARALGVSHPPQGSHLNVEQMPSFAAHL